MKVFYIGSGFDGCYYVRCLLPLIHNGWVGDKISLRSEKVPPNHMLKMALECDVIVFQRPMLPDKYEAALLLKKAGKKIVMDNDDTYSKDSGVPTQMMGEYEDKAKDYIDKVNNNLMSFANMADMVTVSTPFLAKEYEGIAKKVVVLPNCVDQDDWDTPQRNKGKKVRIGLVGSVANSKDYIHIKPLIEELSKRDDVQLVIHSLPPNTEAYKLQREVIYREEIAFWEGIGAEMHNVVDMEDYFETLNGLQLDMMLIPRQENYFNKCKSNIKFLEASMLEIPVIAQKFSDGSSPYENDNELLLAGSLDEWRGHIETLIANKKLRRALGRKAKKYVLEKYNITTNAHLWENAYVQMF